MNNEKPYIEHNGNTYEFEASFKLKRQFDKENKENAKKLLTSKKLDSKKIKEIQELQKWVNENPNINIENLDEETRNKLLSLSDLVDTLESADIYEKYCYLMLKEKYDLSEKEFESILEGLANDYGFDFITIFVTKVCEKVFTQVGEKKEKKTLPSWMNEH